MAKGLLYFKLIELDVNKEYIQLLKDAISLTGKISQNKNVIEEKNKKKKSNRKKKSKKGDQENDD